MINLNLAHILPSTNALGPGNRFAIWVQGCPFDCKGCVAPDWIPFKKAQVVEVDVLATTIIGTFDIDGITISGGEPMMQAGRLTLLLKLINEKRPDINVIIFTGFTKRQLVWNEAQELISHCDLLIDGQYVEHKNDGMGLRGSNNQQFHFLTERLLPYEQEIIQQRKNIEIHLLDDGALLAGIPNSGFYW